MRRAQAEYARLDISQAPKLVRQAYLRYAGQGFEIKVDLPDGAIDNGYATTIAATFHQAYERTYGYRDDDAGIEGVDWQLAATFPDSSTDTVFSMPLEASANADPIVGKRQAYFPEARGFIDCKVVDRYRLKPGVILTGPAIVEEVESTTIVLPGDVFEMSSRGNLKIAVNGGAKE